MLRLSLKRYSFVLTFQMFFLIADLILNSFGVFFKERNSITFLYFLQDVFLILSLASLIYSCYSTYIYQAGLTEILHRQFRIPVLITVVYIVMSITLHIFTLYKDTHQSDLWTKSVTALFVTQKLCKIIQGS